MKASRAVLSALIATTVFIGQTSMASAETIIEVLISYTDTEERIQVIEDFARSASDPRVKKNLKHPDRCLILLTNKQFKSINSTDPRTLSKYLDMYISKYLDRAACTVDKYAYRSSSAKGKYSRNGINSQSYEFSDLERRLEQLVSLRERGLITEQEYKEKKKQIVKETLDKL